MRDLKKPAEGENSPNKAKNTYLEKVDELKKLRNKQYRTMVKSMGSMIATGMGWGIYQRFGIHFNDGHIGLGGTVSNMITCWELYK